MVVVLWIVLSLLVGFLGSNRKIGFWGAFLLSLLLSPVIGLIIALVSKDKAVETHEKAMLESSKKQAKELADLKSKVQTSSIADELKKLQELKDSGMISEEEYQKAKDKILS